MDFNPRKKITKGDDSSDSSEDESLK